MTDHSTGENNIESLAQRAKEVLDRVRANADDTSFHELDTVDLPDVVDVVEDIGDIDVETPSGYITALQGTDAESDLVGDVESSSALDSGFESDLAADLESDLDLDGAFGLGLDTDTDTDTDLDTDTDTDLDVEPEPEPDLDLDTELNEPGAADLDAAPAAVLDPEPDSAMSTDLVPTRDFDADSLRAADAEEDDGRKFGCLLPLLLLGLIILGLLVFWGSLFGSDDDPVLSSDGSSSDVTASSEASDSPDSSADTDTDTDTTVTTNTTTTTSTTTTEAPAPIPGTAWELLDVESNTDQFASFASSFGLQGLLESADGSVAPDGFTLLAPSNDAIAALSQDEIAGFGQDPSSAEALIGYHIIDQRLTPDLLLSAAGGQIQSRVGLPIDVAIEGDDIVLNGQARVAIDALVADNGNVLVIDTVLDPPTINSVIDLGEVQFEVISAIITPQGEAELQKAVTFFQENPDVNAVIEGHTDTDGPAEPNQRLSERRAEAVRTFLISQGVDGSRLTAEGFGETQPIIVDGVEDKTASRRIELNIR